MVSSSMAGIIVDSAVRSLFLAMVVGLGLALSRTRNVVAQKAAWTLVMCSALLMPAVAPWAARIPGLSRVVVIPIPRATWLRNAPPTNTPRVDEVQAPEAPHAQPYVSHPAVVSPAEPSSLGHYPAPTISSGPANTATSFAQPEKPHLSLPMADILLLLYLAGCAALLVRLGLGMAAALQLWNAAEPVSHPAIPAELRVRVSNELPSPVTIGSGIVLPAEFAEWDEEKLQIVLAHEASHVRQGDFYLQLCAALYTAIFWFSPLGWLLKRKLSDLSETISDRAAVDRAASHATYAQVLLEFAALPRPIPTGVAMANHGHVISRIERLLNESSFRQAFAGGRARIAAAVLLVPVALYAATTLVPVKAAQSAPPPPAAAPSVSPASPAAPNPAPVTADTPVLAPAAPEQTPAPPAVAPVAPDADTAPPAVAPVPPAHIGGSDVFTVGPDRKILVIPDGGQRTLMLKGAEDMAKNAHLFAQLGKNAWLANGFAYRAGFGDDSAYAFVSQNGETKSHVHFSGNWGDDSRGDIEKARKIAHGDFLWFERDGKSYVIDDPAVLATFKPMQDKMEDLGKQQEALGRQQEELGRQQEELGKQQMQARVPTPDMSKELASLTEAIKKLDSQKNGTTTVGELAEIESKLGDLQGRIGEIQGRIGEKQGEIGSKQGELGEKQGKLGEQQGRLGAEQGRIARQMDGKVLSTIDECLKNGKARPVQ